MDWTIDYLQEYGIVFVKILNPLKIEVLKPFCQQIQSLAREQNSHKYFVDHREVDNEIYISDIHEIASIVKDVGVDLDSKIAVLVGRSIPQRFKLDFVQNVFSLISIQISFFYDKDEALDWLKSA